MEKHSSFTWIAIALTLSAFACDDGGADDGATGVGGTTAGLGGAGNPGGTVNPGLGGQGTVNTTPSKGGATSAQTSAGGGAPSTTTPPDPGTPVNCDDTSTFSKTLAARYDGADITVTGKSKSYHVTTNWWHKFTDQSIAVKGIGYTVDNSSNVSVPASDGAPIGYPTIFIGTYAGSATTGSNLPKQVSALTQVNTVIETNSLSLDTSNFNAAYDVWFTASGSPLPESQYDPGKGGAFLMVWLFDPSDRQPRGRNRHPRQEVPGVPGTWDVWIDATDPPCISYVSTEPRDSLSYDLNKFIQHSVTNQYGITNNMYLSVVFAGFEIWGGGDGLQLKRFCADVK